ncbi:ArnT family glycosyltransferase [Dyella subtropica]|uniref:ArnT family glycosyltransferase n=1 Tax=Dyella subtropica TaxID=2992127 RepID=UPI0022508DAD|nr:glycosyltransferase family 39 protein [Dyella subtropica]
MRLKAGLDATPWLVMLLLLPFLGILPPVPIDETRYLSIAWEMRQSGELITLHLNGSPYFDKPPLLFWLLNLDWSLFGVSLWGARVLPLLFGAGCIALLQKLERELDGTATGQAPWLMLGFMYFELFSGVVMFDVMLCFFVLLAFVAIMQWMRDGTRRALGLLFLASALGMLAKGPVALLHLLPPVLLARWWMRPTGTQPSWKRIGAALLVCVLGGLPVLLWALAAVQHLGQAEAKELLVTQTAGRVVESFAHNRALWWYLQWLVPLLLPWPLVLRLTRLRTAFASAMPSLAARFGWCATLPAFVGFSVVSGKQLHYLIPLFPGLALLLGTMLRAEPQLFVSRRMLAFSVLVLGLLLWAILRPGDTSPAPIAPGALKGLFALTVVLALSSIGLLMRRSEQAPERRVAWVMLLLTVALLPVIRAQVLGAMDLRGLAQSVEQMRQQGVPLARTGNEPGLITFLARLPEPLPTTADPTQWAQQHPAGFVLVWSSRETPPGTLHKVRAANGWVALWPASAWRNPPSGVVASQVAVASLGCSE